MAVQERNKSKCFSRTRAVCAGAVKTGRLMQLPAPDDCSCMALVPFRSCLSQQRLSFSAVTSSSSRRNNTAYPGRRLHHLKHPEREDPVQPRAMPGADECQLCLSCAVTGLLTRPDSYAPENGERAALRPCSSSPVYRHLFAQNHGSWALYTYCM